MEFLAKTNFPLSRSRYSNVFRGNFHQTIR
nr:MAG TPA: hypothetical protein [Caudoviricetes sp.]